MAEAELEGLLGRVALGDRRAFERLYSRTRAKLFAVCLRILNDRGEAEDVVQDAYVKIWRYAERYSAARARPMTWMIAIARNLSIDRLRARKPAAAGIDAAEGVADSATRADQAMLERGEATALARCLDELGERDGRLVRLAYFGGVTYAALATSEGTPLGTVKSRMRRALAALRGCLGRDGEAVRGG